MTNIEILESVKINYKQLKEDKPLLLFNILKAMDLARSEALILPVVGKSLKLKYKDFDDYVDTCFAKLKGNQYLKMSDQTVWTISEILKDYTKQNTPQL